MNKKLLSLTLLTLTIGCAERASFSFDCPSCDLVGPAGAPGESVQGEAGFDGHDALIEVLPLAVSCPAGGYSLLTATDSNSNGLIDSTDKNYSLVDVCNGRDGSDGQDAETQIADILNPCGIQGQHDEVLLKIQTGYDIKVLASFSNNAQGDYTRFAVLTPGVLYATTDFSGSCKFRVDALGNLYDEYL